MTWLQGRRLRICIACEFLKPYWALGDSLHCNRKQARAAGKDSVLQEVLVIQQKYLSISVYLRGFLSLDTSVCLPVSYLGSSCLDCLLVVGLQYFTTFSPGKPSRFVLVLSPFLGSTGRTGTPFSIVGFYSTCAPLPLFKLLTAFLETVCWVWYLSGLVISFCWTIVGEGEHKHLSTTHKIYMRKTHTKYKI